MHPRPPIILTGNILTFTLLLIAAVAIAAGAFWLIVQTLDNPWLFIPIDLLLLAALVLGMRTEAFRDALREFAEQVKPAPRRMLRRYSDGPDYSRTSTVGALKETLQRENFGLRKLKRLCTTCNHSNG